MYGKAVKCDVCDRIEIVDSFDLNNTFFDAGFQGWIRVTVNQPRDYGWTFRNERFATTVTSIDACSIDCAQKFLRTVHSTVPLPAEAEVPAE